MIFYYLLVVLMPFTNPPYISRVVSGEIAFKLLGAICALYACAYLLLQGRLPRYFRARQARWFLLLYVIACLSYLFLGLAQNILLSPFMVYSSFLLLLFVTLSIVDSLARLKWVLFSANAALALGSVRVIMEWLQFRSVYAGYRAGMSVGDSNYFATSAVLCLPFAFLMVLNAEEQWEKLFFAGCLGISLLGVTVCASRGGFLGLTAASLFLVARSANRIRNWILISVVVLPLALFLPISPLQRLLHPSRSDNEAKQARLDAWQAGMEMIRTHPWIGVGLGNFKPLMPRFADPHSRIDTIAHNTYLEVAAELGLPTLLVFLAIPFFSYRSLERVIKRKRRPGREFPYYAALGLQAGLVGYLVGAFFLSAEYQKLFWLVIMLSMCLPYLRPVVAAGHFEALSMADDPLFESRGEYEILHSGHP